MKYLLDSNTYIQAKNFYYDMDFCPAYWDWLDSEFEKGNLASIGNVYEELKDYGDELSSWVKDRKDHFLDDADDVTQEKFSEVAEYVAGLEDKKSENIANFLGKADPWLIAKASTTDAIVVTHERLDPPNSKNYNLPKKWKKDTNIGKETMRQISTQYSPLSEQIYNLPIYGLLANRPVSKATVRKLMAPYESSIPFGPKRKLFTWSFPNDDLVLKQGRLTPSINREDTESLFQRGDIYGFIGILANCREAESTGDLWQFIGALRDAYRAIPSLAFISPWEDHINILLGCVHRIHFRSITAFHIMGVDLDTVADQISSMTFESKREQRARNPKTRRFVEPKDPTFLYQEEYEKLLMQIEEQNNTTKPSE